MIRSELNIAMHFIKSVNWGFKETRKISLLNSSTLCSLSLQLKYLEKHKLRILVTKLGRICHVHLNGYLKFLAEHVTSEY